MLVYGVGTQAKIVCESEKEREQQTSKNAVIQPPNQN